MQYTVTQIGARQHYAVARAFHRVSRLRRMYTDMWCSRRVGRAIGSSVLRGLAGRRHPDLPDDLVSSFSMRSAHQRLRALWRRKLGRYDRHLAMGSAFGRWTARHLQRQAAGEGDVLFAFDTGALEALQVARDRGFVTIVDQIDPAKVEEDLVLEEVARWPGWQATESKAPQAYWDRLRREWDAADLVLVNSPWSRRALVQQGVEEKRIIVVPQAYEQPHDLTEPRADAMDRPFTVLWLGHVNLRKGIQYLIEAARIVPPEKVQFKVVGPVWISDSVVASAPGHVQFVGPVPRLEVTDWYRRADAFVLPTISDGFAITQLEAMAHGLPVIATDHCGEVVSDGVDGFIVPVRDAEALAAAIERLASDRDLLCTMRACAIEKSREFTLERYALRVETAVERWLDGSTGAAAKHALAEHVK